jgi:hypothetical protein
MAQSFKLNETAVRILHTIFSANSNHLTDPRRKKVRHLEQLDPEGSCKRLALDQPLSNNVEDGSEVWVIDSTA